MNDIELLKSLISETISNDRIYRVVQPVGLDKVRGVGSDTFSPGDILILIKDTGTHLLLKSQETGNFYSVSNILAKRALSKTLQPQRKKKSAADIRGVRAY